MAHSEIGDTMEAKRARRRRDLARMKAKAARLSKRKGGNWSKLYNHLAHCSGACCGNPRRSFWYSAEEQMTMQERRFFAEPLDYRLNGLVRSPVGRWST